MTYLKHFLTGDKLDLFEVASKVKRETLEASMEASGWKIAAEYKGRFWQSRFSCEAQSCAD